MIPVRHWGRYKSRMCGINRARRGMGKKERGIWSGAFQVQRTRVCNEEGISVPAWPLVQVIVTGQVTAIGQSHYCIKMSKPSIKCPPYTGAFCRKGHRATEKRAFCIKAVLKKASSAVLLPLWCHEHPCKGVLGNSEWREWERKRQSALIFPFQKPLCSTIHCSHNSVGSEG